ncbi:MAG: site-specific integrase [Clostridia bacterium]|nr:site-specific integrase [Clostridia bacterium]
MTTQIRKNKNDLMCRFSNYSLLNSVSKKGKNEFSQFEGKLKKILNLDKKKKKTFKQVVAEWQKATKLYHKGATEIKYDNIIKSHILPDLGDIEINRITTNKINDYIEMKLSSGRLDKSGGLSTSYVRTIMIIINSVIIYACQEEYILPLKGKIYKPKIEKKRLEILDCETQKRFTDYLIKCDSNIAFGVLISLYMGLRIGEVCALSWDDVDLKQNIIHVSGTIARVKNKDTDSNRVTKLIVDKPKTKSSYRDIPIPSKLLPIFRRQKGKQSSNYVISENSTFVNPRTYENRYHRLLDEFGIKSINYHVLRHTFATRCIEAGVDIKTLSELLGHSNVSITLNTYVHSSMVLKRKNIEKICSFE